MTRSLKELCCKEYNCLILDSNNNRCQFMIFLHTNIFLLNMTIFENVLFQEKTNDMEPKSQGYFLLQNIL
jgi:hypothetical protein